jgi:hypothetical protein
MKDLSSLPSWVRTSLPVANEITWLKRTGILNYKWAQTGIYDIYDKSIATLLITLLVGAGTSYFKSGDKPTATTLAIVAIVQGLGVRNGSYSRFA